MGRRFRENSPRETLRPPEEQLEEIYMHKLQVKLEQAFRDVPRSCLQCLQSKAEYGMYGFCTSSNDSVCFEYDICSRYFCLGVFVFVFVFGMVTSSNKFVCILIQVFLYVCNPC